MLQEKMQVCDANAIEWEERTNKITGKVYYRKRLIVDPDTGMLVNLYRYPAGMVTPWHDHPCAHGMYILEGRLHTHDGEFGPGNLVWFPEGSVAEHGGCADTDVTVVFITNKPFDIRFVDAPKEQA